MRLGSPGRRSSLRAIARFASAARLPSRTPNGRSSPIAGLDDSRWSVSAHGSTILRSLPGLGTERRAGGACDREPKIAGAIMWPRAGSARSWPRRGSGRQFASAAAHYPSPSLHVLLLRSEAPDSFRVNERFQIDMDALTAIRSWRRENTSRWLWASSATEEEQDPIHGIRFLRDEERALTGRSGSVDAAGAATWQHVPRLGPAGAHTAPGRRGAISAGAANERAGRAGRGGGAPRCPHP
jgi:hypothetical protein